MAPTRILVVEDERIVSRDIQNTLNRLGYATAGNADTGSMALNQAAALQPDLILMDIRLKGDMDGVEAAQAINRLHSIPVVFLTAASDMETLNRAKTSGSFGFVLKPFQERELQFAIEMALSRHGLVSELRQATRAAQAANETKTAFLATVSHELRTPMNGILGMAELLLHSPLTDEQREHITLIRNSGWALMNVLNDILDYAKIEAKTLELRLGDFNLRELVSEVLRSLAFQTRKKGLTLDCRIAPGVPAWLKGDSGRLRKILIHLLHNALKFTDSGGVALDVSTVNKDLSPAGASSSQNRSVRLLITVADTGIGVPADQMGHIFESFTQLESYMTRRYGGLGLGLATCKQLAELLGGDIWAESVPGQGSEFSFTALFQSLPKEAQRQPPGDSQEVRDLLAGRLVLLAEDDPTSETLATRLLQAKDMAVRSVSGGAEAVAELRVRDYDAVLMDIQMPGLSGLDATRLIRSPDTGCKNPQVPIIALTAHAFPSDEKACLEAGMDAYLTKPVDGATLAATLAEALRRKEAPPRDPLPVLLNHPDTLRRLGGDEVLLREIFQAFVTDLPRRFQEMEAFLADDDRQGALRAAHSLKGAAMNAGAEILRDEAEKVFDLIKAVGMDAARTALPGFRECFKQTLDQVLDHLRGSSDIPKGESA